MVENENVYVVLIIVGSMVIGLATLNIVALVTGKKYPLSEPISNLEPGKVYEVRGLTRDGANCFLLLKAGDTIKFYQLPSNEVPTDLESGDGLVKLSTGLKRLPQEFKK